MKTPRAPHNAKEYSPRALLLDSPLTTKLSGAISARSPAVRLPASLPPKQWPRRLQRWCAWVAAGLLTGLGTTAQAEHGGLMIYCGITMVSPITELARSFEQRENIKITISQGGSEDLYQSASKNRSGDIYFPGEPSYHAKFKAEGLLGEPTTVGYNQIALFVKKGNPSKVRPQLAQILRPDLVLTLGSAESGSVGQESKHMLDRYKLYPAAMKRAAFLSPDSRSLALSLRRGEADITLSWRATAAFPDNAPFMEAIDLPASVAPPQALLLIPLNFSKEPALARRYIQHVASAEGQAVFRRHGFMDASGKY